MGQLSACLKGGEGYVAGLGILVHWGHTAVTILPGTV